jgi:hypothetical protein
MQRSKWKSHLWNDVPAIPENPTTPEVEKVAPRKPENTKKDSLSEEQLDTYLMLMISSEIIIDRSRAVSQAIGSWVSVMADLGSGVGVKRLPEQLLASHGVGFTLIKIQETAERDW